MIIEKKGKKMNDSPPYAELSLVQQEAVELRLLGVDYPDIANKINRSVSTVTKWFMATGICSNAFEERKQQFSEERKEQWHNDTSAELRKIATENLETLQERAKQNPWIIIRILELLGFSPEVQKGKNGEAPPVNVNIIFNKNEQHVNATDQSND